LVNLALFQEKYCSSAGENLSEVI